MYFFKFSRAFFFNSFPLIYYGTKAKLWFVGNNFDNIDFMGHKILELRLVIQ